MKPSRGLNGMKVESQDWGEAPDGQGVQLYTVVNGRGAEAQITNYGGIVVSLKVRARNYNYHIGLGQAILSVIFTKIFKFF